MKTIITLIIVILCTAGCEQKPKPPSIPIDDIRDENGFIPQYSSNIVAGFYYPYGDRKSTYLKWNVDPILGVSNSIHMYLVDSSSGKDEREKGGGGSFLSYRPPPPEDRAGSYISPQQLKKLCATFLKAEEWSRIAKEENLNVKNKELYCQGDEGSEGAAISFTQELGVTNYTVKIRVEKNYSSSPLGMKPSPSIFLDERGVKHFIAAVDGVLERHKKAVEAKENAEQEKTDRQAQENEDAEEADAYLK